MLKWLGNFFSQPITKIIQQQEENKAVDSLLATPGLEVFKNQTSATLTRSTKTTSGLYRPVNFSEYIGQEKAKDLLQAYIDGTKSRQKEFPHLLISGPPGCGKTTLARIIANQVGGNYQEMIASRLSDPSELIYAIQDLDGGIIFVDEIHALDRDMCEPIYPAMEEFIVYEETIKPFTLVGATTELGEIIKYKRPFYDRFKIKIELEDYTSSDIKKIVKQFKDNTFPKEQIKGIDFEKIAMNSRLTPRKAIGLLESTIYLCGNVNKALSANGIIWRGYTDKDLKALDYISENEKGIGVEALASFLGTSKENYVYDIEPYLIKNRLIMRTPRGRKITEIGYKTLTTLKKMNKGE